MSPLAAPAARPAVAARKATLVGGISSAASLSAVAPKTGSLLGMPGGELTPIDVDATLFQDDATPAPARAASATASGGRTTVLPRRKQVDDEHEARCRV